MIKSDIWLYPTVFKETFCITGLEAMKSECLCITTDCGSLPDIIGDKGVIIKGDINDEKIQDEMINKLKFVMNNKLIKDRLLEKAEKYSQKFSIENLTDSWIKNYLTI